MSASTSPNMQVMIKAAEKAARSLVRDFGEVENLQVSTKGPGDFVSAADKRSEQIIFEELSRARPEHAFLMEESGTKGPENAKGRFIIDPLDGTHNFLHGIPHWCISIALEEGDEVIAGLVYDPVKNDMFTAEKGQGAFLQRRKRLRVSGRTEPLASIIALGEPRRTVKGSADVFLKEHLAVQNTGASQRRFGASALDLSYVAAGKCEAYWERALAPWDIAAGCLIVKEAGGFVCDMDDDRKNPLETGNVLAGNEALYGLLKKALRGVKQAA